MDTTGCVDKTRKLDVTTKLTDFFKRPGGLSFNIRPKAHIKEVPCSGLTDQTWLRPCQTYPISHFMEKTCSIYPGTLRPKVCTQLFGPNTKERNLTTKQKAKLLTTLNSMQPVKSSNILIFKRFSLSGQREMKLSEIASDGLRE